MTKELVILECPSNLGLKEPSTGMEPGVKKLPAWLRSLGLYERLHPNAIDTLTPPPYSMQFDEETGVRNAPGLVDFARQQAAVIKRLINGKRFVLAIGGDCSILTGHALGLRKSGRYGLFFLDGHTDFMPPSLSTTGGAAGMDLSIVTGHAHSSLTDIDDLKPYFNEKHVWCVGNREYDPAYVAAIKGTSINYTDLQSIQRQGTAGTVHSFFEMLARERLDGFWIHLDVDVLDPVLMPAVDSPDPGGITYGELSDFLVPLLQHQLCVGMEITILDPDLDPLGVYSKIFVEEFAGIWSRAVKQHRK